MTYFKPVRRKCGVITLLMTCMLAAGWVRSLGGVDMSSPYAIHQPDKLFCIVLSERSAIRLVLIGGEREFVLLPQRFVRSFKINPNDIYDFGQPYRIERFRPGLIFEFQEGAEVRGRQQMTVYVIYYWSSVLPLTALSAWLLLSKPRQKSARQQT